MPLRRANINTNIMGAASRSRATLYVVLENFRPTTGSFENLGPKQGPYDRVLRFFTKTGSTTGSNRQKWSGPGFQKQAHCGGWEKYHLRKFLHQRM